ncbi:hypothetical protein H5410_031774 [Solanum commersonii]|uniref:Putative plant transposon protein domain-containing protein n=1 Tax=Solanum commersonii TaxID=4109 RepID=A0A9J5YMP6_SOLCO|nr:hypothetical protein H5410_031774 [Solanum commersonii]
MARLITEERRVLTESLHIVPDIHRLLNLHKYDWMARDPGTYSEETMREFYASYAATLRGSISKRRFLYGPTAGHSWSLNTAEFDYKWDIVRSGAFQRNSEQYIAANGERAEWVAAPRLGIRKATLNFVAKFFWLLVRNRVSATKADNQLRWDRAVMVATLVAGVEIDFARMLLAEIHERAFRTSTTYPFPCLIFQLCRDSGVPIWHCDRLIHPTGALDIGLIRDEANVAAPRREPQVEVPPLSTDLADPVGQAQGDNLSAPDHTDTVSGSSSQAASMGPSSSRSTPQLGVVVVPLATVKKLEAQMATLLHHIQPWMQKSIAESEARVERRMEGMMDLKVQAVNNRLDAFELRVLERPAPAIDLSALQADIASLRSDVEAILAAPSVEPQVAPTALADDTTSVLAVKNKNPLKENVHQRGNNRNSRPYCNYCNKPGHIRQSCWKLQGRPPRTNNWSTTHMVQTHNDPYGQLASSVTLSGADYSDYLQYQVATEQSPLSSTSQTGNSFACLTKSSLTCPWILDSSASDHITVTLTNGSRTAVKGIGDVQLHPSITLKSVLFAPKYPFDLIFVSKLTKHLNCGVTFLADFVVVQDRRTGKTIGI